MVWLDGSSEGCAWRGTLGWGEQLGCRQCSLAEPPELCPQLRQEAWVFHLCLAQGQVQAWQRWLLEAAQQPALLTAGDWEPRSVGDTLQWVLSHSEQSLSLNSFRAARSCRGFVSGLCSFCSLFPTSLNRNCSPVFPGKCQTFSCLELWPECPVTQTHKGMTPFLTFFHPSRAGISSSQGGVS